MSEFHSTVARRDFMKGLGLAGAGIGAAAAASPIFHDLDELMSSDSEEVEKHWWIKEREYGNPTMEVNWDIVKPFEFGKIAQNNNAAYDPNWDKVMPQRKAYQSEWIKDN